MGKIQRTVEDDGIGMVEVLVAMFLLAIVALSLLPLLITGMQLAVRNTTLAAATQFANDRITAAQAGSPDCAAIFGAITGETDGSVSSGTVSTTDARGVELLATTTLEGTCPTSGAATLKVSSVVTRTDTAETLASASTRVLVTAAP